MGDDAYENEDQDELLPADWGVPEAIRRRLGSTVGRQRTLEEAGHLLVIVHRVPDPDEHERRGCIVWRDPAGTWRAVDGRPGRRALRETIDEYRRTLGGLDARLDSPREVDELFDVLEKVAPIARATRHLHATLQKAREAVRNDRGIVDLRDQAYAVERRAELLAGDARFALDRALARSAHAHTLASREGAAAADRLNRLAALFLPVGTAAALLGMNLPSGLEHAPSWGFWALAAGGLVVGGILSHRIHRGTTTP